MTRVLTSAQQAEVTAAEHERDREAWNLPRKPVGAKSRASSDSQAAAANHADHRAAGENLEWEGFLAEYFPGSRRHNLEAITAYDAYRRSRAVDGPSIAEAKRPKAAGRILAPAAVAAWEDEGGASL